MCAGNRNVMTCISLTIYCYLLRYRDALSFIPLQYSACASDMLISIFVVVVINTYCLLIGLLRSGMSVLVHSSIIRFSISTIHCHVSAIGSFTGLMKSSDRVVMCNCCLFVVVLYLVMLSLG